MDMPQVLGSISCSCPIPLRRDTTHGHATNSKYTTCSCPTPLRNDTTHTDMPQILRSIYHARVQHHSDMTNKYWDLRKCPCYMSNKCPCYITNNYQQTICYAGSMLALWKIKIQVFCFLYAGKLLERNNIYMLTGIGGNIRLGCSNKDWNTNSNA